MNREVPYWWPPKHGSSLRYATRHGVADGRRMRIKSVDALLRVLSVFKDQDGHTRIVTAEWFPTKRKWNYEIMSEIDAANGRIWPDGAKKPQIEP